MMLTPALLAALGVITNPNGIFVLPLYGGYIQRAYGPLFWFIITILLGYLFVSLYLMFQTLLSDRSPSIKSRVKLVLKGILVLIVCALSDIFLNVVLAAWLPIIPGLTSFGIFVSDIFFIIAIHRDKVFDIITIAHQDVIDTLAHGILVVDENETVIEINRSLRPQYDLHLGDRFDIENFLSHCSTDHNIDLFLQTYQNHPLERTEIEITLGESNHYYIIVHVAPIIVNGTMKGRIITFQDVSDLRCLVEETNRQNIILHERNQSLIAIRDELFQTNQKLEKKAITDSLTGCYNRRYLTQQLEHEVIENVRSHTPFTIILLDIDFFKRINDIFGHLTGDEVICSIVETIKRILRQTDILARYGGEEFMIYLPNTNQSQANMLAERVRAAVESNKAPVKDRAQVLSITISMGLLTIDNFIEQIPENPSVYLSRLLASVDEALYQAKKAGRNRIVSRIQ